MGQSRLNSVLVRCTSDVMKNFFKTRTKIKTLKFFQDQDQDQA